MSDYGSDKIPDLNIAGNFAHDKNFTPLTNTNVMQWTYDGDIVVQKFARRLDSSNILFKFDRSAFV